MEDLPPVLTDRFFTHRQATNLVRYRNCMRAIYGFKGFTYYVHDRREDD